MIIFYCGFKDGPVNLTRGPGLNGTIGTGEHGKHGLKVITNGRRMKDPRDNIFITIFISLGFMVVLALFMLAVGQCYGF